MMGDKNKLLIYDLSTRQYQLQNVKLSASSLFEFEIFASTCSLPDGNILVTGGGQSSAVYLLKISQTEGSEGKKEGLNYSIQIQEKRKMALVRKEHMSVYHEGYVYVLGGFESGQNRFLSECEKYNVLRDEWSPMAPMPFNKCSFGAVVVSRNDSSHIIVAGGFNGVQHRLSSIEVYDI